MFVRSLLARSLPAVGLALGLAASAHAAATWSTSRIPWTELPVGIALGPAPQMVAIPAQAYSYGVRSEPVDVFAAQGPVILHLRVGGVTGKVSAAIVTLDGSALLSKEAPLQPGTDNEVYFRLRPGMARGMIVLRNFNAEGVVGAATIRSIRFVGEAQLDNDELAAVAAAGFH